MLSINNITKHKKWYQPDWKNDKFCKIAKKKKAKETSQIIVHFNRHGMLAVSRMLKGKSER